MAILMRSVPAVLAALLASPLWSEPMDPPDVQPKTPAADTPPPAQSAEPDAALRKQVDDILGRLTTTLRAAPKPDVSLVTKELEEIEALIVAQAKTNPTVASQLSALKGQIYGQLGAIKHAMAQLDRVLQLSPDKTRATVAVALQKMQLLRQVGKVEEAIALCTKTMALEAGKTKEARDVLTDVLGKLYLKAERFDELEALAKKVEAEGGYHEQVVMGMKKALKQASVRPGKPFPPLKFTAMDGKVVDFASLKGKVVLVDFWATWCGPCVAEMPNIHKAYEQYHDKGLEIVGINMDQDKAKLDAFLKKHPMPWPQHFDGKGWSNAIAQDFGISSIPAMYLVGRDGNLISNSVRGEALQQAIAKAIAVDASAAAPAAPVEVKEPAADAVPTP